MLAINTIWTMFLPEMRISKVQPSELWYVSSAFALVLDANRRILRRHCITAANRAFLTRGIIAWFYNTLRSGRRAVNLRQGNVRDSALQSACHEKGKRFATLDTRVYAGCRFYATARKIRERCGIRGRRGNAIAATQGRFGYAAGRPMRKKWGGGG